MAKSIDPQDYPLREQFIRFNRLFFNNEIPDDIQLGFENGRAHKRMGVYQHSRSGSAYCTINLDNSLRYTKESYDGTLLHEMVHAYLFLVKGNTSMEDGGHHAEFWDVLNKVDDQARAHGIIMPPTENNVMLDHATGSRRQNMTLGMYSRIGDPPGLVRFATMLPSVFDEIVTNFQFKVRTQVTGGERNAATRPHPGQRFYDEFINWPWYKSIDWDRGIELYQISNGELALYTTWMGFTLSQRFMGQVGTVADRAGVVVPTSKVITRGKDKGKTKLVNADIPYRPELVGIINRAKRAATGAAVVKADGVYINGELIHRPKKTDVTDNKTVTSVRTIRTTQFNAYVSHVAVDAGLPEGFFQVTDPDAVFYGYVLDTKDFTIRAGDHRHGDQNDNVILFVYDELKHYSYAYGLRDPATYFFNSLPRSLREKFGWPLAEKAFEVVTNRPSGIYSYLRFKRLLEALEAALGLPGKLVKLADECGNFQPGGLFSVISNTLDSAKLERLSKVYKALGGFPINKFRAGGVPIDRVDGYAFMEDVFGSINGGAKIYDAFGIGISMLNDVDPWSTLSKGYLVGNQVHAAPAFGNGSLQAADYISYVTTALNTIAQQADLTDEDYAPVRNFAIAIQEQSAKLGYPGAEFSLTSERFLDTLETLRNNYNATGGVLNASRISVVRKAIDNIKPYETKLGNVNARLVRDADFILNNMVFYTTTVPRSERDVDSKGINFLDFRSDMQASFLWKLFSRDDIFLNAGIGEPRIDRAEQFYYSLALFVFGGMDSQMPAQFKEDAYKIWERIQDTANNGANSVIKDKQVPDLDAAVGGRPDADRPYTRKDFSGMTTEEKIDVLHDAGHTDSEIREFSNMGYAGMALAQLPEYYRKAFGGYVWYSGKYAPATRQMVEESMKAAEDPENIVRKHWAKLWTNFKPGQELPANQFGSDSQSGSFGLWEGILKGRHKSHLNSINRLIRQNDRSMNFPFGEAMVITTTPTDDVLTEWEEQIMMAFVERGDPDGAIYVKDLTDLTPIKAPSVVASLVATLRMKDYITEGDFRGKDNFISPTEKGAKWVRERMGEADAATIPEEQEDTRDYGNADITQLDVRLREQWVMQAFEEHLDGREEGEILKPGVVMGIHSRDLNALLDGLVEKKLLKRSIKESDAWIAPTKLGKTYLVAMRMYKDINKDTTEYTQNELENKGYVYTYSGKASEYYFAEICKLARELEVSWNDLRVFYMADGSYGVFYNIGVKEALPVVEEKEEDTKPEPETEPETEPDPPKPPEPEPEEDNTEEEEEDVPEKDVLAPKVRVADGKSTFNISYGVNEKTKLLMFVPVEKSTKNVVGIVRKREAKPVAALLNYVFAAELKQVTKKIRAGQRKQAARQLAIIANRIKPYLQATAKESTPFPGRLGELVERDFGDGIAGQKLFWRFLQGKATTSKKVYKDIDKVSLYAGIDPLPGSKEEGAYELPSVHVHEDYDPDEIEGRFFVVHDGVKVGKILAVPATRSWTAYTHNPYPKVNKSRSGFKSKNSAIQWIFDSLGIEETASAAEIATAKETEGTYAAVTFKPQTVANIHRWLSANNIPNAIKASSVHSTFIYSRKPLKGKWESKDYRNGLFINPGTYKLEQWEDDGKNILVLKYDSPVLQKRWRKARGMGATWDYPEFKPHITLSYDIGDLDISTLEVPTFSLVVDKEYSEPLKTGWAETAIEVARAGPKIDNTWTNGKENDALGWNSYTVDSMIDYKGIRVHMRPSKFLMLAKNITTPRSSLAYIINEMKGGRAIASPYFYIEIPDEWYNGDYSKTPKIQDHEGRHRMIAIQQLYGDIPIEVTLYPRHEHQEFRARKLTPELKSSWLKHLDRGIRSQDSDRLVGNALDRPFEHAAVSTETAATKESYHDLVRRINALKSGAPKYRIAFDAEADQASWYLDANLSPVVVLSPVETERAFERLSQRELLKYFFDPFYGLLSHEHSEAGVALALLSGDTTVLNMYPKHKLGKRDKQNLEDWKNLSVSDVRNIVVNKRSWGRHENAAGLAHELIISDNPTAYYKYLDSIHNKLGVQTETAVTRDSTPKYEVVHTSSGTVVITGVSKTEATAHWRTYPDKHRFIVRAVKKQSSD
jgi:hypothetical protein